MTRFAKQASFVVGLLVCAVLLLGVASPALAVAPAWSISAVADSSAQPGGELNFHISFTNIGTARVSESGTVEFGATMPPGMLVTGVTGTNPFDKVDCSATEFPASTVTCINPSSIFGFAGKQGNGSTLTFETSVAGNAPLGPATARFSIAGGGAEQGATTIASTVVTPQLPGFGVAAFDGAISGPVPASPYVQSEGAAPFTQAGGHPYASSATIAFNTETNANPFKGDLWPVQATRDVVVDLPPGLVGNPNVVPQRCTNAQLTFVEPGAKYAPRPLCPSSSEVGTTIVRFNGGETTQAGPLPVFEMVAPSGIAARFGFNVFGTVVVLDAKLHSKPSYGISIVARKISEGLDLQSATVEFWGVPASTAHDPQRQCPGFNAPGGEGGEKQPSCPAGATETAFLRMPTSCTQPGEGLLWSAHIDSWPSPGVLDGEGNPDLSDPNWKSASFTTHAGPGYPANPEDPTTPWGAPVGTDGCGSVPVKGSLSAQPTVLETETSSGLAVKLDVPNPGLVNPTGIASSDIKAVRVALPVGMTINPSQAVGLGACSPAAYASEQLSFHPTPGTGCPSDSKIGTVLLHTPLLEEAVEGSVYIATPFDNQFGSLLALYVVLKNPERGVLIKAAGRVEPDPVTGQIVTTFEDLPQLPFENFEFKFREGARAPLATPPACGSYQTEATITPWSDPVHTIASTSSFEIVHGIGGGSCPPAGAPPLHPSVVAGTINPVAGAYSPFYLRIGREDGEQEITKFSTVLPTGLTGNLTGIPFCPDSAIETARHTTGARQSSEPSCPATSEIGHTLVGAGVGSVLAWTPGKVYLAGPYHGSALSIVSVTSATVGPFDLGTVVIRFALRINPNTGQVEVDSTGSDPIPHIIEGIVVHVRDIHVYIDRNKFILNPTSCDPKSISNTITGTGADPANPAGQTPVNSTTPFQAADCQDLAFKPAFKASTTGKTSRQKGAGLNVKLTYPTAPQGTQANIRSVKVNLPKQLPSRLTTLQKACPDTVFDANPAACPPPSIVGHATAITPILPVPLTGPAYFVSHGGAKFPELIIVLQGYGVTIDLHGETFISKTGITSSTFRSVPDEPVTSFELTLPQGADSALAANGNLCKSKLKMPTAFTAQNGMAIHTSTPISVTGCAKHKARKASKANAHHKHHNTSNKKRK